jgi:hypothetical protein
MHYEFSLVSSEVSVTLIKAIALIGTGGRPNIKRSHTSSI